MFTKCKKHFINKKVLLINKKMLNNKKTNKTAFFYKK